MSQGVADSTVVIVKRRADDDTGDCNGGQNMAKTSEGLEDEGLDILADEEPSITTGTESRKKIQRKPVRGNPQ